MTEPDPIYYNQAKPKDGWNEASPQTHNATYPDVFQVTEPHDECDCECCKKLLHHLRRQAIEDVRFYDRMLGRRQTIPERNR